MYLIFAKRCLALWIYEWLAKIQGNIIPEKDNFYTHLNMNDITDEDYTHAKRVCKDLKSKI